MEIRKLLEIRLDLFDGGAAAGGDGTGAAAPGGAGPGAMGETQSAVPGSTRRGKTGETQTVLYGKQASGAAAPEPGAAGGQGAPDAGEKRGVETTSDTLEEKRRTYRELVNGKFKDLYTEDTQRIINQRFKEIRGLEQQLSQYRPVIDMLLQRYRIADGDMAKLSDAIENDSAYWSEAAEEAGMSVAQYKEFQRLQRENAALRKEERRRLGQDAADRQYRQWIGEAERLKELYPGFDLQNESGNPQFLSMLRAGVPVQHAYEVLHMEEIKADVAAMQARATEKQVVDGIRAKGARPQENGTSSQSAFIVRDDVSKLTKKDRAEIVRRVARGERIEW